MTMNEPGMGQSETSGMGDTAHRAAEQLKEALLVNPYDTEGTAATILLALQMPQEERRARHRAMLSTCRQFDVHWWCDSFSNFIPAAEV